MSRTSTGRARASRGFACALVIALLGTCLLAAALPARAAPSVTLVLDKGSYLSGDTLAAEAIVYRSPPGNYTYSWEISLLFGGVLASEPNGNATYAYAIPLDLQGTLLVSVTVDDGVDTVGNVRAVTVARAYMSLVLDRVDFSPGDTITAYYGISSHVITDPTYDYEVSDAAGVVVHSGNTTGTSFSYRTPNPASPSYLFHVTASEDANSSEISASISQATGAILGMSFDRPVYSPGETIRVHMTVTPRGTTALPSQFRWFVTPGVGGPLATATTTRPEVDLLIRLPSGAGTGDVLLIGQELNTGALAIQTVRVGPSNPLWSTEVFGIPALAVLLALLVILVLLALAAMWRRIVGGRGGPMAGPAGGVPPPPPEAPRHAAPTPMSVPCRNCSKPIDITTSKRPIEVMCPSCGETQLVA